MYMYVHASDLTVTDIHTFFQEFLCDNVLAGIWLYVT